MTQTGTLGPSRRCRAVRFGTPAGWFRRGYDVAKPRPTGFSPDLRCNRRLRARICFSKAQQTRGRPMIERESSLYRLIETELVIGITYCRAAISSGDARRKAVNIEQAQRAYDEALDYARTSKLGGEMRRSLEYKTDRLKQLLDHYRTGRVIFKLEPIRSELLDKSEVA